MKRLTQLARQLLLITTLVLLAFPAIPDDTSVYTDLEQCLASNAEKYRFIFIVDNSGSMSSWEFTQSKNTIDQTITEVLNSDLNDVEVAVVQYGTISQSWTPIDHLYDVTVPFTSSVSTATNWNRKYGHGTDLYYIKQDHQPASLSKMRLDNVYAAGNALDVTDATNVQFVFFTDAFRDIPSQCCSSLVSVDSGRQGDLSNVYPDFGEYDVLKNGSVLPNGIEAQFTILHVPPSGSRGIAAAEAAAAIASPGGNYTGSVEFNEDDPEGPGKKPRRYVQGNFSVNDSSQIIELIKQVIEEIKDATYSNVAPAVSVNAFNELQHRNEIYYSVFQPSSQKRWSGNVKKFTISSDGVILDSQQQPAIDPATGSVLESARSYWSASTDGSIVSEGGYRSKLTDTQVFYTDSTAFDALSSVSTLLPVSSSSDIKLSLLDLAEWDSETSCVLIGERANGTLTVNSDTIEAESDIDLDPGKIKLRFSASSTVSSRIILEPRSSSGTEQYECIGTYVGGSDLRECEFTVGTDVSGLRLEFSNADVPSEVEYNLEYNIPEDDTLTACGTVETQRTELLSWLAGADVYNENLDNPTLASHQFAADPLHSKPFVITYSGTGIDDAEEVLFVTDNLGALHAINPADSSGEKLWSYLPEEHLDNVKKYAFNKAGQTKTYGLDGHVSVVQRESTDSTRNDYSVREVKLYIGERRGGRNYYAVDVSNATSTNNKPSVDWKIHGGKTARFEDLGQTWSSMLPRKIAYNCNSLGNGCEYLEVLIFSGGYDPAYDESGALPTGALGNALYIVDLETGGDKFFWSAGNNDDTRDQHEHALNLDMAHAMVATPTTIDTDGNGAVNIIFANDISGKLWRIDLDGSLSTGDETSMSSLSALGGNIADLSGETGVQRFYNSPDVSKSNPRFGVSRYIISTGSGHRARPNDVTDVNDKLFVVYDPHVTAFTGDDSENEDLYNYVAGERIITTDDLIEIASDELSEGGHGMFLSATGVGEKFLQSSVTFNNTMIISSYVPGTYSDDSCTVGSGRAYFLDMLTLGSRFDEEFVALSLPGIPPETSILQLPNISICVGTNCASAEYTPTDELDECDSDNFSSADYGSNFSAAVASTVCGLETGRAHRLNWYEVRASD